MTDIDWAALRQSADDATRPVPDGDYDLVVTKAEAKQASTGSPMIALQLRVLGGPSDGKNIFNNLVLSVDNQFALARWFRTLDAFGLDSDWFATAKPNMPQIAAALLDRKVHGTVSIRQWQGQDRNEITGFSPAQSGPGGGPLSTTAGATPGVPRVSSTGPTAPQSPGIPATPAVPRSPTPTTPTVSSPGATPPNPNLPI